MTSPPTSKRQVGDLVERIKESADKLARDGSTRGDLKILSRAMRELAYAFKVFTPYRRHRKVTMFGSARTPPGTPTYETAVKFGQAIAQHDWLVITGAASGIMEAGHVGAGRDHSMGLNILLPFEQEANRVIAGDGKLVHMKYFFTRKLMFVKECDAVVCLPGGFGTLDEALEVLTLLQTGKHDMVPVVLLDAPGGTYWKAFDQFVTAELLGGDMISADDPSLYMLTDNCQRAVAEIVNFYAVYHSMRYVGDRLVLRVQQELPEQLLHELNENFSDILKEGEFLKMDALPEERNEPDLEHLKRLVFCFNRRSLSRLRQLINHLNERSPSPAEVTRSIDD